MLDGGGMALVVSASTSATPPLPTRTAVPLELGLTDRGKDYTGMTYVTMSDGTVSVVDPDTGEEIANGSAADMIAAIANEVRTSLDAMQDELEGREWDDTFEFGIVDFAKIADDYDKAYDLIESFAPTPEHVKAQGPAAEEMYKLMILSGIDPAAAQKRMSEPQTQEILERRQKYLDLASDPNVDPKDLFKVQAALAMGLNALVDEEGQIWIAFEAECDTANNSKGGPCAPEKMMAARQFIKDNLALISQDSIEGLQELLNGSQGNGSFSPEDLTELAEHMEVLQGCLDFIEEASVALAGGNDAEYTYIDDSGQEITTTYGQLLQDEAYGATIAVATLIGVQGGLDLGDSYLASHGAIAQMIANHGTSLTPEEMVEVLFTGPLGLDECEADEICEPDPKLVATVNFLVDFIPIIGDIKGIVDAYQTCNENLASIACSTATGGAIVGLFPFLGDAAGKVIKVGGNKIDEAVDNALRKGDGATNSVLPPPRRVGNLQGGPLENATRVSGRFNLESGPANGTVFRADDQGNITSYATYDSNGRILSRVDVTGAAHNGIPTPHVLEYGRNTLPDGSIRVQTPRGNPRPATADEIP